MFFSISNFRKRLKRLLEIKKGIYSGVNDEIRDAFKGLTIQQIRENRDMILVDEPIVFIKMRLPDRKHRISRRDGYRLIYLVYKNIDKVVLLDIYPKNGPAQQLNISDNELTDLVEQYYYELTNDLLSTYNL